jgi:unsaturated rhamnogalacturonyl hydrolase
MVSPTRPSPSPLALCARLYDRYESLAEVKHYYGLLAIYALCVTAITAEDEALLDRCRRILGRFPDEVEHPEYNFPSYRIGGIPRAFLLFTGDMADERSCDLVTQYTQEMMTAPRDAKGILCHPRSGDRSLVWIDVAMAASPFLLFAGLGLSNPDAVTEAAAQSLLMYDLLLDRSSGLLHQSRGFAGPGRFSTDHWSRGNGWGILALAELAQYLPSTSSNLQEVQLKLREHLQALLPFQATSGLWCQHISLPNDPRNWPESSGTALILYALGTAMRLGIFPAEDGLPAFERGMAGLRRHCIGADGSTHWCCPGCLAPGSGDMKGTPEAYMTLLKPVADEPHSFGPIMLALNAEARLR